MEAERPLSRWLRAVPVALVLCVAGAQAALVRWADLSPWSGGGFGMFSTLDAGGARHLHAFQVRPGIEREIPVGGSDEQRAARRLAERAVTLPSDRHLRDVADWVAAQPSPDHGPVTSVRIRIFRPRFDPDTLAPWTEILREVEIPVGDG